MRKLIVLTLFLACSTLWAESKSLDRLMEGNKRFVENKKTSANRGHERRKTLTESQSPFAIILSCADSRVAPEIFFDEGIGDLFVVRVAGNVVGDTEKESIEFAAATFNSKVILVIGHESCGAVDAVLNGTTKGIPVIASLIEPSIQKNSLVDSIKANAVNMREILRKNAVVKNANIDVQAGYYNLKSGEVTLLP